MSIALIEREVHRFLSTKEPGVICFSGHWGVGKTFAWNRFLEDARRKRQIALSHYSYVSLFGVNSLDELKYSIFENSVQSSAVGLEPSLETLKSNTTAVAKRVGKKSLWFLQHLPIVKNYVGGLGPVWFLSVKEMIICVDDIERHGKDLPVRDILGLVSSLKEQKRCKVVLILNDEALEQEKDKEEFRTYLEKVVDTFFKFEPSAEECARIALTTGTETNELLAESCVTLGISNIRVIKKIERAVRRVEPMLEKFDEQVQSQAVRSLVLLGWSVYEPNRAPPSEYLNRGVPHLLHKENQPITEKEAAWNALLDAYGFNFFSLGEFDLILLDGIQKGFFDPALIEKHASALNEEVKAGRSVSSFQNAWRVFHDSFTDNQEQVLNTIYETALSNIRYMSAIDLNGTVWLMKELGRPDRAADVINRYTAARGNDRKFFDLDNHPFKESVDDPDVIQAFKDKYAELKDGRDPAAILLSIASTHGWNDAEIDTLSASSVDEYYNIFKQREGPELRKVIDTCLQFDRIGNASASMREVSRRAKEALQRIE